MRWPSSAPKAGGGKGAEPAKGGVADAPLAFDVEPKKCVIPPHEHRYVTCYFTPKAMQTFDGAFEACIQLRLARRQSNTGLQLTPPVN